MENVYKENEYTAYLKLLYSTFWPFLENYGFADPYLYELPLLFLDV
jgi:hypothetical protein